ncbi:MAG: FAD-dependent thymidylate synthase [Clostridia bacterium]
MQKQSLNVKLLSKTIDPSETIALAGRLCYSPKELSDIVETVNKQADEMVEKLMGYGHLSTLEHASFTFGIEGVSRALLAQITRHRIASFSVQSQRYVESNDFEYIIPPSIEANDAEDFECDMENISKMYNKWIARGIPLEDARFVLPNAAATRMLLTMNARELIHFFELRTCNRAQWEIRRLAFVMLGILRREAPAIFKNVGPKCLIGVCGEGNKSCKKQSEVKLLSISLDELVERHASDEEIIRFFEECIN